jgi:hypothetical protein
VNLPSRYRKIVRARASPPRFNRVYGSVEELEELRKRLLRILQRACAPHHVMQALAIVEREGEPPFLYCPSGVSVPKESAERIDPEEIDGTLYCPLCERKLYSLVGEAWFCETCGRGWARSQGRWQRLRWKDVQIMRNLRPFVYDRKGGGTDGDGGEDREV